MSLHSGKDRNKLMGELKGRKERRRLRCKIQCGTPLCCCLLVCQSACMCLIGSRPNWHVLERNLQGLIKPDRDEAW